MRQDSTHRFGQYITRLRQQRKLSVRELARAAELNAGALSRIENGQRTPRPETIRALASALDIPIVDMFAMAGYITPYDLPSVTSSHVPTDKLSEATRYLERLIDEYDLEPDGPADLEDEINEASPR